MSPGTAFAGSSRTSSREQATAISRTLGSGDRQSALRSAGMTIWGFDGRRAPAACRASAALHAGPRSRRTVSASRSGSTAAAPMKLSASAASGAYSGSTQQRGNVGNGIDRSNAENRRSLERSLSSRRIGGRILQGASDDRNGRRSPLPSSADAASTSLGLRLARSSSHRSSFLTMGISRTTGAAAAVPRRGARGRGQKDEQREHAAHAPIDRSLSCRGPGA